MRPSFHSCQRPSVAVPTVEHVLGLQCCVLDCEGLTPSTSEVVGDCHTLTAKGYEGDLTCVNSDVSFAVSQHTRHPKKQKQLCGNIECKFKNWSERFTTHMSSADDKV